MVTRRTRAAQPSASGGGFRTHVERFFRNSSARRAEGGPTEVRAVLAFSSPPVRAVLTQADLILE
jgi:hypothetical protein